MSEENVELVRRLQVAPDVDLVALFRDDARAETLETVAPLFDPDFTCRLALPDSREHAGLHGLREAWLEWLEPWASYRTEIEDVIDAGDSVVVLTRDYGRRPGTEAEVRVLGAAVWTMRDGKIVRAEFYGDRDEALKAAGLSEY
jgi:ketosteroid isomerase-like protein